MKISVIGLGKLGACTAACFAYKGYEIIGIDINDDIVKAVNEKKSPHIEPQLEDLIKASEDRLISTKDFSKAINDTDITFIILPTPSKADGGFSDEYLRKALEELSNYLKNKDKYHTFVIVSTVSPTTTEISLIPLIENISGKKLNKDFGVVYNPEFIALGSVIRDFLNPDMVLIGESSKKDGDIVEEIYRKVCENSPYFARMPIVSAEITKISLNSFVTMKISFANTLGNICEKIPGADVDAITKALGADKRISPYYLKAGPPYGGPCFPRDNRAFSAFASKYGIDAKLAKATDEINDFQVDLIIEKVLKNIPEDRKVSIIGLSYKDGTPVVEESVAVKVIDKLAAINIKLGVYNTYGYEHIKMKTEKYIYFFDNLEDCLNFGSLHILCNYGSVFKEITSYYLNCKNVIKVIDIWKKMGSFNIKNIEAL